MTRILHVGGNGLDGNHSGINQLDFDRFGVSHFADRLRGSHCYGDRPARLGVDLSTVLLAGACMALVWANALPVSYFTVSERLSFVVNQVGMSLFFGLLAAEIIEASSTRSVSRASVVLGAPSLGSASVERPAAWASGAEREAQDWRQRLLAAGAAAGGILGAAVVYIGYLGLGDESSVLSAGWPIVCAADVTVGCRCLAAFGTWSPRTCSPALARFLFLVSIVSNAIGLVVIELRYSTAGFHVVNTGLLGLGGAWVRVGGGALVGTALLAAHAMRRMGIRSLWAYVLGCGLLSWCGFFLIGLYPALALVPVGPFLKNCGFGAGGPMRHRHVPAAVALFLFALVNAGVVTREIGTGTWAVALAMLAGRPASILAAVGIAAAAGLRLTRKLAWSDMVVAASSSTIGLVIALFLATATFPVGPVLNQVKLGVLMAAAVSWLTLGALHILFARRSAERESVHSPVPCAAAALKRNDRLVPGPAI